MTNAIRRFAAKSLIALGLTAAIIITAIRAPQTHSNYIRNKVGSQVVMLTNQEGTHGGTGFAVKTPTGQVLTLTNAHVCAIAQDDKLGNLYAKNDTSRAIPLKVIEVYDQADLCLVQGIPGMSGVKVAGSVDLGENLGLVGHPKLMPLTLSKGELIGYANVAVMIEEGPCERDAGMYKTVDSFFGPVCVELFKAGLTNIPALGGNSGSPVVNIFGNLTGVLYAGDSRDNWGVIVPLDAIKDFLRNY